MSIEWICKHHGDLAKEQLYAILQLRTEVFVVEQRCAYQEGLECAAHCWAGTPVYLSAQAHLQGYYNRHGFEVVGEEYLEDDIPHIGMRKG
ncbi:hypothetical protein WR25_18328 [Diploscapter pachys]|uniref:N-acetyltransferase domain-containing protein n=1 Tax=Diploscapter pachys TaxID=2018661 RepID=A0A2A2KF61_9BILA|nr:hypothetical protein WR25_18328 [Diploscapter pachys]